MKLRFLFPPVKLFCVFSILLTPFCQALLSALDLQPTAEKLYKTLQTKPFSETVFERFHDVFMQDGSSVELEAFLTEKSKGDPAEAAAAAALMAQYYAREGMDAKALTWLETALKLNPKWPEAMLAKAKLQLGSGKNTDAVATLEEASKTACAGEVKTRILKALGKAYARDGFPEKSVETWRELAKSSPGDFDLEEETLELEIEEGLFKEAEAHCAAMMKSAPSEFKRMSVMLRLGDIYKLKGEKPRAVEAYCDALDKLGTGSWLEKEILSQIEQCYRSDDDLKGLVARYKDLCVKQPGRVELLRRKASAMLDAGDAAGAAEAFRELVKATPKDKANKEMLADALEKSGKREEALSVLEELSSQYPSDPELPLKRAALDYALKRPEKVLADLRESLARSKKSEYAYLRLAKLLASYRMEREAGLFYDELVAAYPESLEAAESRSAFLYLSEHTKEAVEGLLVHAKKGGIEDLLRIVRALCFMKEREKALDVMLAREEEFKGNFKYLEEALSLSSTLGKKGKSEKLALSLLAAAVEPGEVFRANAAALAALKLSGTLEERVREIAAKPAPGEAETIFLAEFELLSGTPEKAMSIIDKALEKSPDSLLLLSERIQLCKSRGDSDGQIKTLKRMLESQPGRAASILRELSETCLRAGLLDEAMGWAEKWRKAFPGVASAVLMEARILQEKGNWDRASECLRKAWSKFPDDREIPRALTQCALMRGDNVAAMDVWWRVMDSEKELAGQLSAVREIIQIAVSSGNTDPLVVRLKARMENNPKSVFPPLALAEVYRNNGNYEERRNLLLKVAEMKGEDPATLHEVAKIEEEEGAYDKALSTLERACASDKTEASKRLMAQLLLRLGEEEKAFQLFCELAAGEKMAPSAAAETALSLVCTGQEAKALDFVRPFAKAKPENPELKYALAIALEETENTKEAVEEWLAVLDLAPSLQPAAKPTTSLGVPNNYYIATRQQGLGKLPEVSKILRLQSLIQQAYIYRNEDARSYHNPYYGGYGRLSTRYLPYDLEQMKDYALAHLALLSTDYSEEERAQLEQRLSAKGIRYVGLKMATLKNSKLPEDIIMAMREASPDDENIATIWAMSRTNKIKDEDISKTFAIFKDKQPELALLIFHVGVFQKPKWNPTKQEFDAVLGFLDREMALDAGSLSHLSSLSTEQCRLSPEWKKELIEKLVSCEPKGQDKAELKAMVFYNLSQNLLSSGEYAKLAALLEESFEASTAAQASPTPKAPVVRYRVYRGRGYEENFLNQTSSFPPGFIYEDAHQVFSFLSGLKARLCPPSPKEVTDDENVLVNESGELVEEMDEEMDEESVIIPEPQKEKPSFDKAKIWAAFSSFKNPSLKLLAADCCGKKEEAKKVALAILSSGASEFQEQMLASSWFAANGEAEFAGKALDEAEKKALDKRDIELVCMENLRLAVLGKDNEALRGRATASVAKLLSSGISQDEKGGLAQSLDELGFSKEAELVDKSILQSMGVQSRKPPVVSRSRAWGSVPSRRARTPVSQFDLARESFKNGDIEAGAKILAKEYRKLFKMQQANIVASGSMGNTPHDMRNLCETLRNGAANEAFLKELGQESSNENVANTNERAFALEMLGKVKEAQLAYSKVLEKEPSNKFANMRLALLIMSEDPDKAIVLFTKSGASTAVLVERLSMSMSGSERLSETLDLYPLLAKLLESGLLDKQDNMRGGAPGAYAFMNILSFIERDNHMPQGRIPSLFTNAQENPFVEDGKAPKELIQRRREVYLKLCDACLNSSLLAEAAMTKKIAVLRAEGTAPDESIYRQAKAALLKSATNPSGNLENIINNFMRNSGNREQRLKSFLIEFAEKNALTEDLKAFANSLPDKKGEPILKDLELSVNLASAEEKDFCVTVEKLMFAKADKQPGFAPAESDRILLTAIRTREFRKLKVSLSPAAMRLIKETASSPNTRHYLQSLLSPGKWAACLAKEDGNAYLEYLTQTIDELLKPWLDADNKGSAKNPKGTANVNANQQPPYDAIQCISRLFREGVAANRQRRFDVLGLICSPRYEKLASMLKNFGGIYEFIRISDADDDTPLLSQFKGSAFLNDFEDFSFYRIPGDGQQNILFLLLRPLKNSETKRLKFKKELAALPAQTFGSRLIVSLLDAKSPSQIFSSLEKDLPQLKASTPEKRRRFFFDLDKSIEEFSWDTNDDPIKNPELKALWDEAMNLSLQEEFAAFMAKGIKQSDYWQYSQEAGRFVFEFAERDPEKALLVFNHAVKKLKTFEVRNPNYGRGRSNSMVNSFIENLYNSNSGRTKPAVIKTILSSSEITPDDLYSIGRLINQSFNGLLEEKMRQVDDSGTPAGISAMKDAIVCFAKDMKTPVRPPMTGVVSAHYFYNMNPGNLEILSRELAALDAAEPNDIIREFSVLTARLASIKSKSPPPKAFIDYYSKMFGDPKIPLSFKLSVLDNRGDLFEGSPELDPLVENLCTLFFEVDAKNQDERDQYIGMLVSMLAESSLGTEKLKLLAPPVINAWFRLIASGHMQESTGDMLKLCLKLGDDGLLTKMLSSLEANFYRSPSTYVSFLNAGKPVLAANSFLKNWKELETHGRDLKLSPEGKKAAPDFLAELKSPEINLLAQAMLALVPDDEKKNEKPPNLPELFGKTEFTDKELRFKTYFLLKSNNAYTREMSKWNAELFSDLKPGQVLSDNSGRIRNEYLEYLKLTLNEGKWDVFIAKYREFAAIAAGTKRENGSTSREMLRSISNAFFEWLSNDSGRAEDKNKRIPVENALEIARIFMEKNIDEEDYVYSNGGSSLIIMALYFAAGEKDSLPKIKKPNRNHFSPDSYRLSRCLMRCAPAGVNPRDFAAKLIIELIFSQEFTTLFHKDQSAENIRDIKKNLIREALRETSGVSLFKDLKLSDDPATKEAIMDVLCEQMPELLANEYRNKLSKSGGGYNTPADKYVQYFNELFDQMAPFSEKFFDMVPDTLSRLDRSNNKGGETALLKSLKERKGSLCEPLRAAAEAHSNAWLLKNAGKQLENRETVLAELDSYLGTLAEDETLSPKGRLMMFRLIVNTLGRSQEMAKHAPAFAKLFIALETGDDNRKRVESGTFDILLGQMQDAPDSPEWLLAATALSNYWKENLKRSNLAEIICMLDLHLRLGDTDTVNSMLDAENLGLPRNSLTYPTLLSHSANPKAAEIFTKVKGVTYLHTQSRSLDLKAVFENLDKLLPSFEPELGFLFRETVAAACFSAINLSPGDKEMLSGRMLQLAEEFKKTEFKDLSIKLSCIDGFRYHNSYDQTRKILELEKDPFFQQLKPEHILTERLSQISRAYLEYLKNLLQNGKDDEFIAKCREFAAFVETKKDDKDMNRSWVLIPIFDIFHGWLSQDNGADSLEKLKRIPAKSALEVVRIFLAMKNGYPGTLLKPEYNNDRRLLTIVLYFAAGEKDSISKEFKTGRVDTNIDPYTLVRILAHCAPEDTHPGNFAVKTAISMLFSPEAELLFGKEKSAKDIAETKKSVLRELLRYCNGPKMLENLKMPDDPAARAIIEEAMLSQMPEILFNEYRQTLDKLGPLSKVSPEQYAQILNAFLDKLSPYAEKNFAMVPETLNKLDYSRNGAREAENIQILKARKGELYEPLRAAMEARSCVYLLRYQKVLKDREGMIADTKNYLASLAADKGLSTKEKLLALRMISRELEVFPETSAHALSFVKLYLDARKDSGKQLDPFFGMLLHSMLFLPDSPEWQAAAKNMAEILKKDLNNSIAGDAYSLDPVDLYLRLGDSKAAYEILENPNLKLWSSRMCYPVLLNYSADPKVAELFGKLRGGGMSSYYPARRLDCKAIFENLEKLVPTMEPELAFLFRLNVTAACFFSCSDDFEDKKMLLEKMCALAEEYKKMDFKDSFLYLNCISVFRSHSRSHLEGILKIVGLDKTGNVSKVKPDSVSSSPDGGGFVFRWTIFGPFSQTKQADKSAKTEAKTENPSSAQELLESELLPDEAKLSANLTLPQGKGLRKFESIQIGNCVELSSQFGNMNNAAAYAVAVLDSPQELVDLSMLVGSDDYIKVWLNGKLVHTYDKGRPAKPDQDKIGEISLQKGQNTIVVKCVNISDAWRFYLRFAKKDGSILQVE